MTVLTLERDGVLTLPAATRDELRLKEGDRLEAEVVDGALRLRPLPAVDREEAWRMIEAAPSPGLARRKRRSGSTASWRKNAAAALKAVLDGSTLVSAFLTPRSASGQVLDAARARVFVHCPSRAFLDEVTATSCARRS